METPYQFQPINTSGPHNPSMQSPALDIIIQMPESQEKEKITNINAERDQSGSIILSSVTKMLNDIGYPVLNTLVSYFSPKDQMYILINRA
jgi:hypothetical protein